MGLTRASRTAILPGMMRADHQTVDGEPKILVDPVAQSFLDDPVVGKLRIWLKDIPDDVVASFRSTFVIRSAITEQLLGEAVARSAPQYLVLAAGLDTFALRQPAWARDLPIIEVDHPLSQAYKRERIAAAGHRLADNVRFLSIDFAEETLAEGLKRADLDRARPLFISWLGCTMYLTRDQIQQTLRPLTSWPGGAELSATFLADDWSDLNDAQRRMLEISDEAAKIVGEPWHTLASPAEAGSILLAGGFRDVRRIDRDEIERRCGFPRFDRLGHPCEMLFHASNPPRGR